MSGLWESLYITVTSPSERNVLTVFAVWHGTLSSINTASWLIAVLKLGTCFFNISLYTVALILPCSLTRGPAPKQIMPNTLISSPSSLTLLLLRWGEYRSLGLRRTNLLLSQPHSVPWYFNAKVNISSFRDSGCCRKSTFFFIHYQYISLPLQLFS